MPTAKKKRGLAAYKTKRRATTARRNPAQDEEIPEITSVEEMGVQVGTAFVGYGSTRLLARILYTALRTKYPKLAPWGGTGSTAIVFLLVWLVGSRSEKLRKYHAALTVGAGIALLQNMIRTWVPKLGWMIGDYQQDAATPKALPSATKTLLEKEADLEQTPQIAADSDEDVFDDIGDVLNPGETQGDLYSGVFAQ